MEPSDCEIAELCSQLRDSWGLYLFGNVNVIAIRGSATTRDWAQNLLPMLYHHPMLGEVHAGLLTGAADILDALAPNRLDGRRFVVAGHSRGGALACLLAGLLRARGQRADAIVTFGAPRAGTQDLKEYLQGIPVRQYRNGLDAITEWPDPPFCHVADALLSVGKPLNPKADHALARYVDALREAADVRKSA